MFAQTHMWLNLQENKQACPLLSEPHLLSKPSLLGSPLREDFERTKRSRRTSLDRIERNRVLPFRIKDRQISLGSRRI